jgi:hypothetical protein
VALIALGVAFLIWTRPGQRLVVDEALSRVRGAFAGELHVDDVRSSGLLFGVTLGGVRLDTGDGRPFLALDSIRARYSLRGLLVGEPRLSSVTAWGLRVEISRYTDDQDVNVAHLLPPSEPTADSVAGAPTEIGLGRVRVVGGLVEVLSPVPAGADTAGTVPSPVGGGRLSRLALDSLGLELDQTRLRLGGSEPFSAFLGTLSTEVRFADRPIRVVGAEGRVRYGPGGLSIQNGFFRFPGTVMTGSLELGPRVTEGDSWAFAADLTTDGSGSLADLRWIDPRIPDGSFQGGAGVVVGDRIEVDLREASVDLEASELTLDGGLVMDDGLRLDALRVKAAPLVLARLEPWMEGELPVDGFLTGDVTLSGTPDALRTDGRVTLVPTAVGGGPTTADLQGTLHLGSDPGFTDFRMRLDPLNFGLADAVAPGSVPAGTGRATVNATGRFSQGVQIVADVTHGQDSLASRAVARGTVRHREGRPWSLDLLTELRPFSLDLVAGLAPAAELRGPVRGSVRTVGPLDSLRVLGTLEMGGGQVEVDGGVDVFRPDSLYRLRAELREVALSEVSSRLPAPSRWTGRVDAEGSGFVPDSLDARVEMTALRSRIGGLHVDSATASFRAGGGLLTVDTLDALLGGVELRGGGTMGLVGEREGEAHLAVRTDAIGGLRSLLLGDTVMAGDTLTVLERELLRFQGVNPDTLPDTAQVAMSGGLRGQVTMRGSLESFSVDGRAVLLQARFGDDRVDSLDLVFEAHDLPAVSGAMRLEVDASDLEWEERSFQHVQGTVSMMDRAGEADVRVLRRPGERLEAAGRFALDTLGGGSVALERARLQLDSMVWEMARPSRLVWSASSVRVDSLEVSRTGEEPMHLLANGLLAREDESDFSLDLEGLRLGRVARLLELGDLEVGGAVGMTLSVRGPASRPAIDGAVRWQEPRYGDVALDSLSGSLRYRERNAEVDLSAWDRAHEAFTASGTVPLDLSLGEVADRTPSLPVDLHMEADSLDAASALSFVGLLEDVEGTVSGEFDVGGTLDSLEPRGVFRLQNAAWSVETLGVRHRSVNGSLTLHPDRTVDVELTTRAAGSSSITGTVRLEPLDDPSLDLTIDFTSFQAVSRSDIEGRISGSLGLTGRYRQPLVQGSLTVDQGTLFLEEFARNADVVDLSDPRVLQVVDTTALATRPILEGVRNPFLDRLRVDVDMSVPRDTWLRSPDMNVEMGGDLLMTYDRTNRDMVLVGELQALRGSYAVLGRTFEVQGGTVGFIGTPGINPTLDIQAVARIPQMEDSQPLSVTASVQGTLTQPRVQLSSDDAGLAESDLVSYLIFGSASPDLSGGLGSWRQDSGIIGAATRTGVTYLSGTIANQLGSALAREVGVDYLNITQVGNVAAASGVLTGTKIEVGQYVSDNVFIVLVLRPSSNQGNEGVFGGARVEWTLDRPYTVEGFVEDRFLRSGVTGFQDLGFQSSRVVGVFIFREWGY